METTVETYHVEMIYDNDNSPVAIHISSHHPIYHVLLDDVFPNALIASAFLRDTLSLQYARQALEQLGIDHSSKLWDLNHER